MSATCEVLTPNIDAISPKYQKINTTLLASFLEKLEDKGYFYVRDLEEVRETEPMLYSFMKPDNIKSALFYTLYGVDDTIGFVLITTVGDKEFTREDTLSKVACTAQLISALINFDKIYELEK